MVELSTSLVCLGRRLGDGRLGDVRGFIQGVRVGLVVVPLYKTYIFREVLDSRRFLTQRLLPILTLLQCVVPLPCLLIFGSDEDDNLEVLALGLWAPHEGGKVVSELK